MKVESLMRRTTIGVRPAADGSFSAWRYRTAWAIALSARA